MKRPNIYDLTAIVLFFSFVCGSVLINRTYEQKEQNFPVWKTIELNSYKNTDIVHKALESNGFRIEYWANDIFHKISVGHEKNKLDLVLISAVQLDFNDWVSYQDIDKRAHELGLKFLPAEVGPQLRLQYKDQPENEWLHIAMKPLIASDGDPTIFDILHFDNHAHGTNSAHDQHGHSLQLCSSSVRSDVLWSPSSKWVFAKN